MNQTDNKLYRIGHEVRGLFWLYLTIALMSGCAASQGSLATNPETQHQKNQQIGDVNATSQGIVPHEKKAESRGISLPARPPVTWQPSFKVGDVQIKENKLGLPKLKVGADIESRSGKVSLRDIIRELARLKGFTVSWNQDVNQDAAVDVDIQANDDFWTALDNILRQLDYFFEFKNNTLIIGYKETKTYQVAMPNISYNFTAAVGGNMLGGPTNTKNLGEVSLATVKDSNEDWAKEKNRRYVNRYDLWKELRQNLDQILEIWEMENVQRKTLTSPAAQASQKNQKQENPKDKRQEAERSTAESAGWVSMGRGSYTIDESLGILTVNASPSLQRRVKRYINTFKSSLYRQVSIQVHILEVQLSEGSSKGIDWSKVLKDAERDSSLISGQIGYGKNGVVYQAKSSPEAMKIRKGLHLLGKISLAPTDFKLLVNALEEQGTVHTLSEPRLNLLNGSPGVLTVGESIRYIRDVSKDVSNTGTAGSTITYTAETDDILSGLAFSVVCNILGNNEVVLYLTPVTSELKRPIEYKAFGPNKELQVGLPDVKLRQMSTMAKIRDNDFLILGGLIDETRSNSSSNVPLLGRIPLIKWAFRNEIKSKARRELVIILQPHILPNTM